MANGERRVAPDAIRGCRRQQETVRADRQFRVTKPTSFVGARPKCPPAWRLSNQYHSTSETSDTCNRDISTTKNTKYHESKSGVSPDVIRAERSEQEVTAAAFNQSQSVSSVRQNKISRRALAPVDPQPVLTTNSCILSKRVAPDVIRGCRRQHETVRESLQSGFR